MTGSAILATPGAQGFDSDSVLTAVTAQTLVAQNYVGAIRYVSRVVPNNPGDITAGEAQTILGAGLALLLVQHCPPAYWTPSAGLGLVYGSIAAQNAAAVGYPHGCTLALDLENMRPGCGVPAIVAYCNAWSRAVRADGYQDMVYYSADCPLTPNELYLDLITTLYWRGGSADAPTVAVCGPSVQQFLQAGQVAGIDLDRDVMLGDSFGRLPMWWAPPPPASVMVAPSGWTPNRSITRVSGLAA